MNETQAINVEAHRVFVNDDLVETGYQKLLEGPDAVAQAACLERKGGPCPYCGVEFARVDIDNKFGQFSYYQPACRCFPVCRSVEIRDRNNGKYVGRVEGCGRFLITEKLAGVGYCTSCYSEAPGAKAKAAKAHKRAYGGKDAAAGEVEE